MEKRWEAEEGLAEIDRRRPRWPAGLERNKTRLRVVGEPCNGRVKKELGGVDSGARQEVLADWCWMDDVERCDGQATSVLICHNCCRQAYPLAAVCLSLSEVAVQCSAGSAGAPTVLRACTKRICMHLWACGACCARATYASYWLHLCPMCSSGDAAFLEPSIPLTTSCYYDGCHLRRQLDK